MHALAARPQEIVRPDVFWYDAALKSPMPFGSSPAAILGLVRASCCCDTVFLVLVIRKKCRWLTLVCRRSWG